ncbi:MAG: hypothetical protein ACREUA_10725 [Burkholderiales bacterium]
MDAALGFTGGLAATMFSLILPALEATTHNFPQGTAVGVGFGSGNPAQGTSVASDIGLQNGPEGLGVALALYDA